MDPIYITKTFIPPLEEYTRYLEEIWSAGQITNQGPQLLKLEQSLKEHLGLKNLQLVANGTLALQLAIRALDITEGEIITTPFSYVATSSAILWEHCTPVYVDIEADTLTIDANKIEAAITNKTKAIMPVHVFGNPCDTEKIEKIARKHNLKVIYDAAHAFRAQYKGKSLLGYGDISVCSFHATKLFHTVEGGCIITNDDEISSTVDLLKRFGHNYDEHIMLGLNAKESEFHAIMGLCNLNYVDRIISKRQQVAHLYDKLLDTKLKRPSSRSGSKPNFSYYPVIFESEDKLLTVKKALEEQKVFPRRYFYPSLNTVSYLKSQQSCPISESITSRILCLPQYFELEDHQVERICKIISQALV